MTTEITARDKKLLYGLGIIVIVALFYIIGIRPLDRKIKKTKTQKAVTQVEFDTAKMKLFQLDTLTEFEENAIQKTNELSARYYKPMVSAEVDRMFTKKALGYGLKVNNLYIKSGSNPVALLAYSYSQAFKDHTDAMEYLQAKEVATTEATTEASTEKGAEVTTTPTTDSSLVDVETLGAINSEFGMHTVSDTTPADVYATRVTLDVYGDKEKAQSLLDELIKDKSLKVYAYVWSDYNAAPVRYENGELVAVNGANYKKLIIDFDMYMYNSERFDKLKASDEQVEESTEATTEDPNAAIKEEIENLPK